MDSINYGAGTGAREVLNSSDQEYNPDKSGASSAGKLWVRMIKIIHKLHTMYMEAKSFNFRTVSAFEKRSHKLFNIDMKFLISKDIKNKVNIFHKNLDDHNHVKKCKEADVLVTTSMEACNKSQDDMVEAFNIAIKHFEKIAAQAEVEISESKSKIIQLEKKISSHEETSEKDNELCHELNSKLKDEKENKEIHAILLKKSKKSIKHHKDSLAHAKKHRKIITKRKIGLVFNSVVDALARQ